MIDIFLFEESNVENNDQTAQFGADYTDDAGSPFKELTQFPLSQFEEIFGVPLSKLLPIESYYFYYMVISIYSSKRMEETVFSTSNELKTQSKLPSMVHVDPNSNLSEINQFRPHEVTHPSADVLQTSLRRKLLQDSVDSDRVDSPRCRSFGHQSNM